MKTSALFEPKEPFHAGCLNTVSGSAATSGPYHQSELFEMIWIKKGKGSLTVDLEKRQIVDNTLYCLFPGQIHRLSPEQDLVGYKVAFSEDFLCGGRSSATLPPALNHSRRGKRLQVMRLNVEAQTDVEYIVRTILWEYGNQQRFRNDMLHGLVKMLIACFSRRFDTDELSPAMGNDQVVFGRFMNRVEQYFRKQKLVSAYAADLSVSSNYLSEVTKRVSGHSASHHIHQRVLLEAQRKAVSSAWSMKEIALHLGFQDPSTFSKFFKTQTGANFSDFRTNWLQR